MSDKSFTISAYVLTIIICVIIPICWNYQMGIVYGLSTYFFYTMFWVVLDTLFYIFLWRK